MSTYNIKANSKLFNKWVKLPLVISRLNTIVQNDMDGITAQQLREWDEGYHCLVAELEELHQETVEYLLGCKGK